MLVDILHQAVLVFAHFKEIGLFLGLLHLAAAVGTAAVFELQLGEKRLAGHAVEALVFALVDVALVVELFEDLLHDLFVVRVGCADELVVRAVHKVPNPADFPGNLVHICLGRNAFFFGLVLDFLAMLVGAGQKEHVLADQPLEAGDCVCQNNLIGVADMRLLRGVRNGCGYIKLVVVLHGDASSKKSLTV